MITGNDFMDFSLLVLYKFQKKNAVKHSLTAFFLNFRKNELFHNQFLSVFFSSKKDKLNKQRQYNRQNSSDKIQP
jgi:hypothetical protein